MGMSLSEIPCIGTLQPRDARELARSLRMLIPRGEAVSARTVREFLQASAFEPVRCDELVNAGWLVVTEDGRYSADTYERRLAAGAVDGTRMSFDEAAALAEAVRTRVARIDGYRSRVRVLRVVLYGSAVRSTGNTKPDIGDLDLAVEIDISNDSLYLDLEDLPEDQQWRTAIEKSGWDKVLMEGDDRVTVAGSLTRVLALFNRQLHGLDLPPTDQTACLVTLWQHPAATPTPAASADVPALWRPSSAVDEISACPDELLATLAYIEHRSLQQQERANMMADRIARLLAS